MPGILVLLLESAITAFFTPAESALYQVLFSGNGISFLASESGSLRKYTNQSLSLLHFGARKKIPALYPFLLKLPKLSVHLVPHIIAKVRVHPRTEECESKASRYSLPPYHLKFAAMCLNSQRHVHSARSRVLIVCTLKAAVGVE
jgi:hypothetical protein